MNEPKYEGKWKTRETNAGIHSIHRFYLVKNGKTLVGIEASPDIFSEAPCHFLVHDTAKNNLGLGYFDEKELKTWFDEKGIKTRPPYHKTAKKLTEIYNNYMSKNH